MRPFMKMVHTLVFLLYLLGLYWDNYVLDAPPDSKYYKLVNEGIGGRHKFLTYLNMVLQCLFFGVCLLIDLACWRNDGPSKKSILQRLHDAVFTTLVFPIGMFVCFIFWGLYAVDRELIFPASMDSWFPGWLNHVMHTLPVMGTLAELCLVHHHLVTGFKSYLPIIGAYLCYVSWICYIAYASGVWVYPVFEILDFKMRSVFLAALLLPNLLMAYLCQKIHLFVWGSSKDTKKRKGKKN